jgi:hypothetical protein
MQNIKAIIPASLTEQQEAIGNVIAEIPSIVNEIIAVSNNHFTEEVARIAGATVLSETVMDMFV